MMRPLWLRNFGTATLSATLSLTSIVLVVYRLDPKNGLFHFFRLFLLLQWQVSSTFLSLASFRTNRQLSLESDMSTPSKRRASSITSSDVKSIRYQLREDFETQIHRDIAVETFVQAVWGLDKDQVKSIRSHTFQCDPIAMQEYDYKVKNHQEPTLYEPFSRIARSLIQSYLNAKGTKSEPAIRIFQKDGKSRLAQTNANLGMRYSNGVKPDALTIWTPSDPSFRDVQTPVEFKKTHQNQTSKRQRTTLSRNSDHSSTGRVGPKRVSDRLREHGSVSRRNLPAVDEERTWGTNEGRREESDEDDEGDLDFDPRTTTASGSKRKHRGGKGPDGGHTLTHDESQLASYALECFAASSRLFVVGIFIKDYAIHLWYYDRMGAARTIAFEFGDTEVQLLGLVLVALHMSDATRSGFSPFLHCAPSPSNEDRELYSTAITSTGFSSPPTQPISETLLSSNVRPPSEIKDAILRFPCVEISGGGKAKTVFRVFSVVDILYSYRGLNGRGTQTFSVHELVSHERLTKKLVAKLLWSSVFRAPETRTLSRLSEVVPELKGHLPEVVFACVYDSDKDLHLPRYNILPIEKWNDITISHVDFEKRDLAVIVMKKYDKLWNVETLDEFKDVFVDLVECKLSTPSFFFAR